MALATAFVAWYGERLGRRGVLVAASLLSAVGLVGVALAQTVTVLAGAAFVGMVNGMGRDRGAAQTLDQSILADTTPASERTRVFTRYALLQDVAGALGSLAAGLPALLARADVAALPAYRWTLATAGVVAVIPAVLYAALPAEGVAPGGTGPPGRVRLSVESRRRVRGLTGLFALDSVGGGLLAGSIVTYWFFRRFGLGGEVLGPVFFAARALNAASYVLAEWLARRIGLIRTMVFTHLPSSVVLIALPFVGSAPLAIALFLVREALVQMDVPTRQSYVAAVTQPGERTFALGVTGVVRNVGWASGPPVAGWAMSVFGIGAPLVLGAAVKIVYDVALYVSYRQVRPPEEARREP
jgi:MFS family permease